MRPRQAVIDRQHKDPGPYSPAPATNLKLNICTNNYKNTVSTDVPLVQHNFNHVSMF